MKKLLQRWLLAALAFLPLPAQATQYDFGTIDPATTSGTQLAIHLNNWRNALHTLHSGSSRPTYAQTGTPWLDTTGTPTLLRVYDGTTDVTLGPVEVGAFNRLYIGTSRPAWGSGAGFMWVNTTTGSPVLTYYNGTSDVVIGELAAGQFGVPPGVEAPYAGITAPTGWYLAYGQAVSRTTDAALFNAITLSTACTTSSGSTSVTGLGTDIRTIGLVGAVIEGPGVPPAATVSAAPTSTTLTLSAAAGGGFGTGTCRIFPFGNGDGSSTFNVPDRRGRVIAGRGDMGGTDAARLTSTYGVTGTSLSSAGGTQSTTLAVTNLPAHTHTGTTNNSTNTPTYLSGTNFGTEGDVREGSGTLKDYQMPINTTTSSLNNYQHSHGFTTAATGSDTAFSTVQPTGIANIIIKR